MGRDKKGRRGGLLLTIGTFCGELCKLAELVEMPFGLRTCLDPRNHVLDVVQISQWEGAIMGERVAYFKV